MKDGRKQFFIHTTRVYLEARNIEYSTYEVESGSVYFHINLHNSHSAPCVRISDHRASDSRTKAFTLLWNVGKTAKAKDVKKRIERSLDNVIANSQLYSTYKIMEEGKI